MTNLQTMTYTYYGWFQWLESYARRQWCMLESMKPYILYSPQLFIVRYVCSAMSNIGIGCLRPMRGNRCSDIPHVCICWNHVCAVCVWFFGQLTNLYRDCFRLHPPSVRNSGNGYFRKWFCGARYGCPTCIGNDNFNYTVWLEFKRVTFVDVQCAPCNYTYATAAGWGQMEASKDALVRKDFIWDFLAMWVSFS